MEIKIPGSDILVCELVSSVSLVAKKYRNVNDNNELINNEFIFGCTSLSFPN